METRKYKTGSIHNVAQWWASIRPYTSCLFRLIATSPAVQSEQLLDAREMLIREMYSQIIAHPFDRDVAELRQLLLKAIGTYLEGVDQAKRRQYVRSDSLSQAAYADLKTMCVLLTGNGVNETLPI